MTKYDTFVNYLTDIKEGVEIEISIRDCSTYDARVVKAIVHSDPEKLPGADTLIVRFSRGQLATKKPWAIKIVEELGSLMDKKVISATKGMG